MIWASVRNCGRVMVFTWDLRSGSRPGRRGARSRPTSPSTPRRATALARRRRSIARDAAALSRLTPCVDDLGDATTGLAGRHGGAVDPCGAVRCQSEHVNAEWDARTTALHDLCVGDRVGGED